MARFWISFRVTKLWFPSLSSDSSHICIRGGDVHNERSWISVKYYADLNKKQSFLDAEKIKTRVISEIQHRQFFTPFQEVQSKEKDEYFYQSMLRNIRYICFLCNKIKRISFVEKKMLRMKLIEGLIRLVCMFGGLWE